MLIPATRCLTFIALFIAVAVVLRTGAFGQEARFSPAGPGFTARQVAAAPADVVAGLLRLPAPSAGAVRSRAAFFPLRWKRVGKEQWRADVTAPVAAGPLGFAVQGPGAIDFEIEVQAAGEAYPMRGAAASRRDQAGLAEGTAADLQRWDVNVAQSGSAVFSVSSFGSREPGQATLVLRDAQPLTAAAYVDSHELLADRGFALVAQVERDGDGLVGERLLHTLSDVWAHLEGPGMSQRLRMRDDGRSGDGEAGDGRFGVRLPAGLSGAYAARVDLQGTASQGAGFQGTGFQGTGFQRTGFQRTTRVTFEVAEPLLALTGRVGTEVVDARRMRLDIGALGLADRRRVQVSAEVWAHDALGRAQPMTWLSRIELPLPGEGAAEEWRLPLWLDSGWFAATGLRPPLELREVRVQDPAHFGVLASAARLNVPRGPLPPLAGRRTAGLAALAGLGANAAVPAPSAADIAPVLPAPGLMLVHGYCSGGNPWPVNDFNQPRRVFSDANQNRTHDEFATRIASQGAGLTSFGVVGHSQGGAAALHLLTFYQSPLDRAAGPRRIQSVGTPYQGTPLASLGFFACGVNNNLTPGGAATWLASIPSWARAEVSYYTTANDGFACQFLTDLLLSNPEDGTTERSRGQLPGGINMGHVTGWCHTSGMSDPPQTTDGGRNAVMNAEAAR